MRYDQIVNSWSTLQLILVTTIAKIFIGLGQRVYDGRRMPPTGAPTLAIATLIASLEGGDGGETNLCLRYARACEGNLNIPRINMPQFDETRLSAWTRRPLDVATRLERDDVSPLMLRMCKETDAYSCSLALRRALSNLTIEESQSDVDDLVPTQNEVHADVVGRIMKKLVDPRDDIDDDERIVVSLDGHVVDGHHRWFAHWLLDSVDRGNRWKRISSYTFNVDTPTALAFGWLVSDVRHA